MLKDLGVEYVIIGHSERRAYFAETDEIVNKKVHAAFKHGLNRSSASARSWRNGKPASTEEVCRAQTEAALQGFPAEQAARVVIAYEPIWAIGTGKSSTAEDAGEVIALHPQPSSPACMTRQTAEQVRIQYGGSVKPDNVREFMAQPEIDGALVGGASLEPASYIAARGRGRST